MARIIAPTAGQAASGTKVLTDDGAEVHGIMGIDISIKPFEPITATISLVANLDEMNVQLLLCKDTLVRSAEAQGYELVAKT